MVDLASAHLPTPAAGSPTSSSRLLVDAEPANPAWDAFVSATPGGHHAQTSRWARVKAVLGWEATRLVVYRDDTIVAGVQVLTRSIGRAGSVGFAPRGPLIAEADPSLLEELHRALMAFGRERGIRYLKVQPAAGPRDLVPELQVLGWAESAMEAAPTATVRVRLDRTEDEMLAAMRSRARSYVRQAARRGLVVRQGGVHDLESHYRIVSATSERQGFVPYPASYYETMFREFAEDGEAALFVAELDGEVLSSTLLIGCNDTATYKMGGWAGVKTRVSPNEAIHWAGMQWAKAAGYRFYDFDGIHKSIAVALERDGELPASARGGVTAFKLQFGGDVVLMPGALDTSPSAILRPAVRMMAPRIDRMLPLAHRALGRARPSAASG